MGEREKIKFNSNETISASEIGQFQYCSMSWYLQKCGFEPKSPFIEMGTRKHIELGKSIDKYETTLKKSNFLRFIGYMLILSTILTFVLGVIL